MQIFASLFHFLGALRPIVSVAIRLIRQRMVLVLGENINVTIIDSEHKEIWNTLLQEMQLKMSSGIYVGPTVSVSALAD